MTTQNELLLGGIGAGFDIAALIRQDRQLKRLERFNERNFRASTNLLRRNTNDNIGQILKRLEQQRASSAVQIQNLSSDARTLQGAVLAQSADSGTVGRSVAALTAAFERDRLEAQDLIQRSFAFAADQAQAEIRGQRSQLQLAILQGTPAPSQRPSLALGITSALLGIFAGGGQ